MCHVIPNRNILAKQLCADSIAEKRALIEDGESAKIVESEADSVEHGGGLKDDRVFARLKLARRGRFDRLLSGDFGQALGIQVRGVGRISFLPSRGIGRKHGDGNFG